MLLLNKNFINPEPAAAGFSVLQESSITLFSQNCRGEAQSNFLRRQILFGLAFLLQFVMANMPVSHENEESEGSLNFGNNIFTATCIEASWIQ